MVKKRCTCGRGNRSGLWYQGRDGRNWAMCSGRIDVSWKAHCLGLMMEMVQWVHGHQCICTHHGLTRIHLWEMPIHVGPTSCVAQLLYIASSSNTMNPQFQCPYMICMHFSNFFSPKNKILSLVFCLGTKNSNNLN